MVRDLDTAIDMIREDEQFVSRPDDIVIEEVLNALLPPPAEGEAEKEESAARTREKLREKLEAGELEERYIEITVEEPVMPQVEVFSQDGMDQMGIDMGDVLSGLLPPSRKKKKMRIRDARNVLFEQVVDRLVNMDEVRQEGLRLAEEMGIIFIDEIDKIAAGGREEQGGPGVSRQGVQRDLLPFLEGTTVRTRYGAVTRRTSCSSPPERSHVRPLRPIPELQGGCRCRVDSLTASSSPHLTRRTLIAQYKALPEPKATSPMRSDRRHRLDRHRSEPDDGEHRARQLTTVMERLRRSRSTRTRGAGTRCGSTRRTSMRGLPTSPRIPTFRATFCSVLRA
jgi:ATP-dependent HslUV protease ATP-binding subunit HslU